MKRVVVHFNDGQRSEHRCRTTSWGHASLNLIMHDVESGQPGGRPTPVLVVPLAGVRWFKEENQ